MSEIIKRANDDRIDKLEVKLAADYPLVDCPLVHRFTPGMYIREIFMPTGVMATSRCHNTCHPFTISKGSTAISIDGVGWDIFEAPFTGITQKGTRRILYILDDCIFTTYHPIAYITGEEEYFTDEEKEKLAEKIMDEILENYENKLFGGKLINNVIHYKEKELDNV